MRQGLAEPSSQSTALPVEIGFLAHHGHPPETLRQAAILAQSVGVSADEFVLKHNLVGEDDFYRALGAELQLPFLAAPRLSRSAHYPNSVLSGIAPLADRNSGFVMAPRAEALARVLRTRPRGWPLAVTSPSRLRKAVFRAQGPWIAHRAASDLAERSPDLATDLSYAQIAVRSSVLRSSRSASATLPG